MSRPPLKKAVPKKVITCEEALRLFTDWVPASEFVPSSAQPVCVLRPSDTVNGRFMRDMAQYLHERWWYYMGSDQQMRDVIAWWPTPPLPPRG